MAHAQKPDFVFRRNGRVHLNRRGCQFSRLLAAEVCASAVVMLDTPCPATPFASFPFTSPTVRHLVPSHFNWSLQRMDLLGATQVRFPRTHEPPGLPLRGDGLLAKPPEQKPYREELPHPLPDSGCRCSVSTVTTDINPLNCSQRPSLARSPFWVVVMQPPIGSL